MTASPETSAPGGRLPAGESPGATQQTGIPTFTDRAGRRWACWVVRFGPLEGATRYEWRSADGRFAVWREGATWVAAVDGRPERRGIATIILAMDAARTSARSGRLPAGQSERASEDRRSA